MKMKILYHNKKINNKYTHNIVCALIDSKTLNSKSYSDQTERFSVKPSSDNQYIFILYHYDKNTIHEVQFKNRLATSINKVWIDKF